MPESVVSFVLVEQIDALLPQTQCRQCGYTGCRPYAQALAEKQAPINRCPPGGSAGIAALAKLLDTPPMPLDSSCGSEQPRQIASITPEHCIGCTLCIQACPVDAIIGSNKKRHAVIADHCTGCALCLPPCPVDCISMITVPGFDTWSRQDADAARSRLQNRQRRLATHPAVRMDTTPSGDGITSLSEKSATIKTALARARARRHPS
ncbi:MAG: RnfABCDGE type electron transport complex subunit B [Burkholderiaceae bacterium]|jgi:electron transport complex protein RnfB